MDLKCILELFWSNEVNIKKLPVSGVVTSEVSLLASYPGSLHAHSWQYMVLTLFPQQSPPSKEQSYKIRSEWNYIFCSCLFTTKAYLIVDDVVTISITLPLFAYQCSQIKPGLSVFFFEVSPCRSKGKQEANQKWDLNVQGKDFDLLLRSICFDKKYLECFHGWCNLGTDF